MLLRFSVENFMSFNSREEFSMAASKITRLKSHTVEVGKKRVLKGGFIYGANASGKSNLIKAISTAKEIIIRGFENVDLTKKHFRICDNNCNNPGVFQFDFILNQTIFSYGFAFSYSSEEIVDEWFYEINDNKEVCIFSRETTETGVKIISDLKLNIEDSNRFNVYKKDIQQMNKSLFLVEIAKKKINDTNSFEVFDAAYNWFKKIIVIFPESRYSKLNNIAENEQTREKFKNYLSYFDTGIDNVENIELDFDKALLNFDEETRLEVKKEIIKNVDNKPVSVRGGNVLVSFYKSGEDIKAKKIMLNHGNPTDLFDYKDESDGTKRLFDLIPIFLDRYSESIIFIDEIDRSLHSSLTLEFIRLFYMLSTNNRSQLIVTTHDPILLDLDKIRQDEIWFLKRNKDHSSKIYSLDKFNERYDKRIEKDYLLGRYGAVPVFSSLSNIIDMDVNDNGE